MEVNRAKSEIIKYFKLAGYQLRSENALLLVENAKDIAQEERRAYLEKILSNVQKQHNVANSIEKENVLAAIRVIKAFY